MTGERTRHLILYDGVCGLCNRLIQFILLRDRRDHFQFAALQSPFAVELLRRENRDPGDLYTVYVVAHFESPEARLLWKGRAIVFVLRALGGFWRAISVLLGLLPSRVLDFFYEFVAAHRYRLFGRTEKCLLPEKRFQSKFIDLKK